MLNIYSSNNISNFKIIQFVVLLIVNLVQSHEAPTSTSLSSESLLTSLTNLDILIKDAVKEYDKIITHSIRACKLDVHNDTINPQPLLIQTGSTNFYNPNSNGIIEIQFGRSIELSCNNQFSGKFANDHTTNIIATCIGDKTFLTNGKRVEFSDFVCDKWSTSIARRTNKKCHHGLATLIEIGFELTEQSKLRKQRFLKIAEVCHNEYFESTLYVYHKLNPASLHQQHSIPRISFRKGDFYNYTNVDKMYKQKTQIETIGNIINDGKHHEQYFNEKKSLFLARGHLSAKSDHIYGSQQRATFYYINAAPQWQIFNAGNWQTIEDSVKNFVGKHKINVNCYTGTWGIGTLPDSNGKHHDLYMHIDENDGIGRIPVPKLYYRVVIEPKTKSGIVLIGVNNPHLTIDEIENDYIICDDISDMITWINWDKKNIKLGYSYACEVSEFVRVVDHLPYLDVTDILY